MTLSGPKNQSILLRIAPATEQPRFMKKNDESYSKYVFRSFAMK